MEMQKGSANANLTRLVDYVMQQIMEYHKNGFELVGIIEANRSPNCGIDTTSDNDIEVEGKGLFMEKLAECLLNEHLTT